MKYPKSLIKDINNLWLKVYQLEHDLAIVEREITEINTYLTEEFAKIKDRLDKLEEVIENGSR